MHLDGIYPVYYTKPQTKLTAFFCTHDNVLQKVVHVLK